MRHLHRNDPANPHASRKRHATSAVTKYGIRAFVSFDSAVHHGEDIDAYGRALEND
jgi:hypothetical protein